MARIEIRADRFTDRTAQPQQRPHVVDVLMTVQLEAKFANVEPVRVRDEVAPVRDQHLVPLPAQDLAHLRRPLGGNPVGVAVALGARAAGHHHHAVDAHEAGELDRLARHRVVAVPVLSGVQRIARTVERANRDTVFVQARLEITALGLASQHAVEIEVRSRRPVAAAEFEHVEFESHRRTEQRIEVRARQAVGDHADFHRLPPTPVVSFERAVRQSSTRRSRKRSSAARLNPPPRPPAPVRALRASRPAARAAARNTSK